MQEPDSHLTEEERLRRYWPGRTWRKSREGNWYLNSDGFNLAVSDKGAAGGRCSCKIGRMACRSGEGKAHQTLEAAKMAAFDALMWAKRNL